MKFTGGEKGTDGGVSHEEVAEQGHSGACQNAKSARFYSGALHVGRTDQKEVSRSGDDDRLTGAR